MNFHGTIDFFCSDESSIGKTNKQKKKFLVLDMVQKKKNFK